MGYLQALFCWYYDSKVVVEMNEESDGMNEGENNSQVVILPDRSNVDELLISGQSNIREDPSEYEKKLDEKLKDLGLWEDDMTINQKEELLAVVVISCETAEQEENKRQLIKEYLEGAQNLPDEIEFTLQESAWLADQANLLCATAEASKDDTAVQSKFTSYTNFEPSTSKHFDGFDSVTQNEQQNFRSSPEIFEDATAYSELFINAQPSTSNAKGLELEKVQSSTDKILSNLHGNVKLAVSHPIVQEPKKSNCEEFHQTQLLEDGDNIFLENSLCSWKPCMSPKSKPLSDFRCCKEQNQDSPCPSAVKQKVDKYQESFNYITSYFKTKQSSSANLISLNKPYLLLHHGSLAKKACKLDNYDIMVGVSEKAQVEETQGSFNPSSAPLTRAKSAFYRVRPSQGRLVSFPDDASTRTTRSGATYSTQKVLQQSQDGSVSAAEIILDDLFDDTNEEYDGETLSEQQVSFQDTTSSDAASQHPQLGDLQPDILKASNVIAPSPIFKETVNPPNVTVVQSNCILRNSLEKSASNEPKIGIASEKGYSSDSSSSLIDVETVADDEINDFVMKRKLAQSSQKSNFSKTVTYSKKLKKNNS